MLLRRLHSRLSCLISSSVLGGANRGLALQVAVGVELDQLFPRDLAYICRGGARLVQDVERSRKYCVYVVVNIEISAKNQEFVAQ